MYKLQRDGTSSESYTSTTMAQSNYTDYTPEGYCPKTLRVSSAWAEQCTPEGSHVKTMARVSATTTTFVRQERFNDL